MNHLISIFFCVLIVKENAKFISTVSSKIEATVR